MQLQMMDGFQKNLMIMDMIDQEIQQHKLKKNVATVSFFFFFGFITWQRCCFFQYPDIFVYFCVYDLLIRKHVRFDKQLIEL